MLLKKTIVFHDKRLVKVIIDTPYAQMVSIPAYQIGIGDREQEVSEDLQTCCG